MEPLALHTEEDFMAALGDMDNLLWETLPNKKLEESAKGTTDKVQEKTDGPAKENLKPSKKTHTRVEGQNTRSKKLAEWKKQKEDQRYKHVGSKLQHRREETEGSKTDMRRKLAEWKKVKNEEKARQAQEKKKLRPAFSFGIGPKTENSVANSQGQEKTVTVTKPLGLKARRNTLGPATLMAQNKAVASVARRKSVAVGLSSNSKPGPDISQVSVTHKGKQPKRASIAVPVRKSMSSMHRAKSTTSTGPGARKSSTTQASKKASVPTVTVSKAEGEKTHQQLQGAAQKRKSLASQEQNEVVKKRPRKSILKMVVHSDDEDMVEEAVEAPKVETKCQHVKFLSPAPGSSKKSYAKTPARTPPITKEMSMREKLDIWLKEKNKTPSRFHHLYCFGHDVSAKKAGRAVSASNLTTKDLTRQQEKIALEEVAENLNSKFDDVSDEKQVPAYSSPDNLTELLDECLLLNNAGCPAANIMQWLDEMLNTIPSASSKAEYWAARCTVVQGHQGSVAALAVLEEGIRHEAKPAEKLADALRLCMEQLKLEATGAIWEQQRNDSYVDTTTLSEQDPLPDTSFASPLLQTPETKVEQAAKQSAQKTPRLDSENVFRSSAVKYQVQESSNYLKRLQMNSQGSSSPGRTLPTAVVTPVRRSTRRSITQPTSSTADTFLVDSLEDLPAETQQNALYMPNGALPNLGLDSSEYDSSF